MMLEDDESLKSMKARIVIEENQTLYSGEKLTHYSELVTKLMKGKALRKHSLHEKKHPRFYWSCSSVVIKDATALTPPSAWAERFPNVNNIQSMIPINKPICPTKYKFHRDNTEQHQKENPKMWHCHSNKYGPSSFSPVCWWLRRVAGGFTETHGPRWTWCTQRRDKYVSTGVQKLIEREQLLKEWPDVKAIIRLKNRFR